MFNNSKYVIDLTPKIASKNDYKKYYQELALTSKKIDEKYI